jgi:methyltransferase-like protein/ubiquinone/menaquinone biosynthesis C-methylase UbiE
MSQDACPSTGNPYDAVPYLDQAYSFAHPRHIEALAALFGMEPAPITKCRVLELGCAAGGNILPEAGELPDSQFLGIDFSERQIDDGRRAIETLGLKNVELRQANILDINDDWGRFDYIISHGILSWVPPEVQEKVFEISQRNLAPNGVAFISYNTYPGWHLGAAVRDLMRYHAARFPDPQEQITQAKGILEFLAELNGSDGLWSQLLKQELDGIRKVNSDNYMFHEHLEADNHPLYLHEFVERAEAHGLQYLADTEVAGTLACHLPEKARAMFADLPQVKLEQYMDFMSGRRFRRTLVCHRDIVLNRQLRGDRMKRFWFSLAGPTETAGVDIRNEDEATFLGKKGKMQTTSRLVKAAMMLLKEVYPRYVSFVQLYAAALGRLQQSRRVDLNDPRFRSDQLAEALLSGFCVSLVELCVHPPRIASQPEERPKTTPLARFQAAQGKAVTSLRHDPVRLGDLARRLLLRLDGSHDRKALMECLREGAALGELTDSGKGQTVRNPDDELLSRLLDNTLAEFSRVSLLSGS